MLAAANRFVARHVRAEFVEMIAVNLEQPFGVLRLDLAFRQRRIYARMFDRLLPGRKGFAVEQQREWRRNSAHAMMDEAFKQFRPTWRLERRNQPRRCGFVRSAVDYRQADRSLSSRIGAPA